MSSYSIHLDDKENTLRQVGPAKNEPSNENFRVTKKQPLGVAPRQARVPLGGKDQNKAFPTLQRSQTSITQPKPSFQQPKQNRRRVLPSQKVPTLRKANSSLGFVHQKSFDIPTNPFNNTLLSNNQLRPKATDSLVKKNHSVTLPKIPTLASTFSSNTQALHSSNFPAELLSDVDPVKRKRGVSLPAIPQHLIEDETSVETIPESFKVKYKPLDVAPLTDDDLEVFSRPTGKLTEENRYDYPDVQKGINSRFDEIDMELSFDHEKENEKVNFDDQPQPESVGLTADELNDLLDF